MKYYQTRYKIVILTSIVLLCVYSSNAQDNYQQKLDCFSIVVGKDASVDGSVIFTHNEDTGMKLVNYYKVPGAKYATGEEITLKNGGKVLQVAETTGYLWINMPGIDVCDSYINEYGVTIGSDGCPSREKNPEINDGGIVFWLRRIVAERAHSAREGVKIAGRLIDKFGYASSGRTYIIADSNEGWMLSVVNGKHWVAQRVPDDKIAVIPNYYTIGEIDLSDTINFLGSSDIIEYAVNQGWYAPSQDGSFHFAKAYSRPGSLNHPGNINRMWRGVNLVSGDDFDLNSEFPFAVKPKEKVSIQNIMMVLRDHYEGTELDKSLYNLGSPYGMNGPTICAQSTQYSFVAHLRNWLPVNIGSVMWIAPYRPDVQAYSPWYSGVEKVQGIYGYGNYKLAIKQQFNPDDISFERNNKHAFWSFVSIVEKVDENYGTIAPLVKTEWTETENTFFEDQESFENKVLKILKRNPDKAKTELTKYSNRKAKEVNKKAKQLVKKI